MLYNMKSHAFFLLSLAHHILASPVPSVPTATNVHGTGVTYHGIYKNSIEAFIGIRYANDTGGENRFKPPVPYTPASGSTIAAKEPGPSCPQRKSTGPYGIWSTYDYITETSEDCLRLNVWRPNGTAAGDKLPVLVYIHGGLLPKSSFQRIHLAQSVPLTDEDYFGMTTTLGELTRYRLILDGQQRWRTVRAWRHAA